MYETGLTGTSGVRALHNIWGIQNATEMAALSLLVLVVYAMLAFSAAVRLFTKAGTR